MPDRDQCDTSVETPLTSAALCQIMCQPSVGAEFCAISAIDSKGSCFACNTSQRSNPTLSASIPFRFIELEKSEGTKGKNNEKIGYKRAVFASLSPTGLAGNTIRTTLLLASRKSSETPCV